MARAYLLAWEISGEQLWAIIWLVVREVSGCWEAGRVTEQLKVTQPSSLCPTNMPRTKKALTRSRRQGFFTRYCGAPREALEGGKEQGRDARTRKNLLPSSKFQR